MNYTEDLVLQPRRFRLAEALAAVTDVEVDSWHRVVMWGWEAVRTWSKYDTNHISVHRESLPSRSARLTTLNPEEAWEAMASHEVIQESWVQSAERSFLDVIPFVVSSNSVVDLNREHSHPIDVVGCVAFAADVEGMTTAEHCAREAVSKLGLHPQRVLWLMQEIGDIKNCMRKRASVWCNTSHDDLSPIEDLLGAHASDLMNPETADESWAGRGVRPSTLAAHPALVSLLATGYVLHGIDKDAITILAPPMEIT